ncbi:MOSC domain-containing protein [Nocardioides phosphati]|uniref:MOSC domain-containing protein n=1 Tax=Nocardioides phosphati TaxID=1867775 RepID=A0ABQ2NAC6_9ACTN|nr:MOSC N-terminal beta barrel domain-containing protein [Nocardioides phosphati]GGO88577.1 MOSC domain-containing protein [Nocardioides phosphati]
MPYRVTRLSITPVKGLQLHHPTSIEITPRGVPGDRQFLLVDAAGTLQSCTHHQALLPLRAAYDAAQRRLSVSRSGEVLLSGEVEDGAPVDIDLHGLRTGRASHVGHDWDDLFSTVLGKPVRLLRAHAPAYDVCPATLVGSASVAELARRAGLEAVDARRFRMLVEFAGGEPHEEDTWQDREIAMGSAVLRGGGLVKRCAATTRNPDSGAVDLQTLRQIIGYRGRQETVLGPGPAFGVYADVVEAGTISVDDVLTLGS